MKNIDDKLRAVLMNRDKRGYASDDVDIAEIKKVFADEGYVKVHDATLAPGVSEGYVLIAEQLMTGAEWLARFEKELSKELGEEQFVGELDGYGRENILGMAKKASGVDGE